MAEPTDLVELRLPSLGSDMEEGTIIEWNVAVGDTVAKGDTVLAVETEKGDIDVETWDGGVIAELCAEVGATIPVDTVIARIATGAAAPSTDLSAAPTQVDADEDTGAEADADADEKAVAEPPQPPPAPLVTPTSDEGLPLVSPRLVFWPTPAGGGDATSARPPDTAARVAHRGEWDGIEDPMRRAIARTMSRANREIPHYHLQHRVDLDAATRWLTEHNEGVSVAERIVMAALFTKAVAHAAGAVGELNGHWTEQGLIPATEINISSIIHRRSGGIVAPVIRGVDRLGVGEVMAALTDLAARAKSGDLGASDLADPTITITNLGDRGVDSVLGVIPPPQVALVGFGRPEERPVVVDGSVVARTTVVATISGDHRATDGHAGARFLRAIDHALQEPEKL